MGFTSFRFSVFVLYTLSGPRILVFGYRYSLFHFTTPFRGLHSKVGWMINR